MCDSLIIVIEDDKIITRSTRKYLRLRQFWTRPGWFEEELVENIKAQRIYMRM